MKRRILAILVTALMVFQTIPATAFAADTVGSNAQQIGAYYQVNDGTGAVPDTPTLEAGSTTQYYDKTGAVESGGAVKVDKTIAPTDTENVFDITLKVSTTEAFDQSVESADAATVLVIDRSGSMEGSRLRNAKAAATQFVSGFSTDVPNVSRKIAVVAFSGYDEGRIDGAYVVQGWTDASNASSINSKINALSANGGTNIEAGLILANSLLSSSAVAGIANKNVILLSDGAPTYGVTDDEMDEACDFANGVVCNNGQHMDGDGRDANGIGCDEHKDVDDLGRTIGSKAKAYAIYVGSGNITCSECRMSKSISSWLSSDCGFTTYSTSDVNQLVNIFANILRIIEMKAEAWIVTDPIGSGVDFVQFNRAPQPANEFTYGDGTITWDIKSGALATPETIDGKQVYTYTLSYRVKLNTFDSDFEGGKLYATNGKTGVTYLIEENNNGEKEYYDGTAYFNIPSVKGYTGDVEFTKLGRTENGSLANLPGAVFTMKHASDCGCGYTHSEWTATSGSDGKVSFKNIPSGHKYVITETSVSGDYMMSDGEYVFRVSYGNIVPEENTLVKDGVVINERVIDIPVEKVWNDGDNENGKRPGSVTVNLLANGNKVDSASISSGDGWKHTFADKLEFDANGNRINYTVTENEVDNYASAITGSAAKYVIKNTLITNISGSKTWNDEDNQDGIRPQTIAVKLLANGVVDETRNVTEVDQWQWQFTNKPVYDENGSKIAYTITENAVEGYTTKVDGYDVTNTHVPATVNVAIKKVWNDADDQDGIRPASAKIQLYSEISGNKMPVGDPVVISADSNGKHVFTDLPRFAKDKDGKSVEVNYTVEELEIAAGYTPEYGFDQATGELTVTNTHEPETVTVEGSKTWEDNDNRDGVRPEAITVKLLADGEAVDEMTVTENDGWAWKFTDLPKNKAGETITYTVAEVEVEDYSATYDGMDITNTHSPAKTAVTVNKVWDDADNQDGKRPAGITLQLLADGEAYGEAVTLSGNWTYTWEDLPKYRDGEVGQEIEYTVSEDSVAGYKADIEISDETGVITVTNTHEPEKVTVKGSKTWEDNNDQDGLRPESITINLLANGQIKDTKEVTAKDGWAWTWEDLDKYADGVEIDYTIVENPVTNYTGEVKGHDVINTHAPFKTDVSVAKVWSDGNDQDGIRPGGIQVKLLANGEYTGTTVTLNDSNSWKATVSGLDKYADGKEIAYTFEEIKVDGYETSYSWNKEAGLTTITNTHTPELTSVEGSKTWTDADDQDGVRPDEITVKLLADGEAVEGKTLTVTAADKWAWSFTDLPKYNDGKEIVYTVAEFEVEVADYSTTYDGMDVVNEHTPEETAVTANKVWADADDQDGLRPSKIELQLLADGKAYGDAVTVRADNDGVWTYTWTELPKYASGEEITYTVSETAVDGYEAAYAKDAETGVITVTNTHEAELITLEGSKTWVDNNNLYKTRPADITVRLLADGVEVANQIVTAEDGWAWSFEDMPKYKNHGTEIVYSISEDPVTGYESDVEGFDVTNVLAPGETEVAVNKVWNDADNQDGIRPGNITVKLLANGEDTGKTVVLDAANKWTGSVTGIPEYDENSTLIEYTFEEIAVEGYKVAVEGDMTTGFTLTNTHEIELMDVDGSKTWADADNQDGIRPEAITVNLLANGKAIDTAIVTAEDNWAWSFKDLPVYEAGKEGAAIEYTVSEDPVEGYEATYDGFNITNTHEIELTSVEGSKTWVDADNQDGIRPEAITVNLLANGEVIDTATVTEADGWAWSFTDLPVYEAGKVGQAIEYTISEEAVEGYEATYDGFNITNTHEIELTSVEGSKTWDDNDDAKGKRPEAIVINLLANGEGIDTVTVTEADDWAWSFTDLPVYEAGKVGEAIEYTVSEEPVEGYNTLVDGFDVVNKLKTPAITGLDGIKVLDGGDLAAGMFEFALADMDGNILEVVANDENGFFTFTGFEFDAAGTYSYMVAEVIPEDAQEIDTGVFYKDGVIYDTTIYNYTVEVVENAEGNFEVAATTLQSFDGISISDVEVITFTNNFVGELFEEVENPTYLEEPDPVPPEEPAREKAVQTGDDFNMFFMVSLALAALAVAGGAFRRKREE